LTPLLILSLPTGCPLMHLFAPLASSPMPPSVVSPPKLELKPLPDSLKYVFLSHKESIPVIISSFLSCDQEEELIRVLSDHKGAIGWFCC